MYLLHNGKDFTEATISQHYYWKNLGEIFCAYVKVAKLVRRKKAK